MEARIERDSLGSKVGMGGVAATEGGLGEGVVDLGKAGEARRELD